MSRGQYRILIHGLALLAGIFPPLFLMYNMGGENNHMLSRLLISITTIPLYLINIKYLIPFFLQKQKYLIYCIALIGLIVVNGVIFNVFSPFNFRQVSVTLADGDPISLPSFPIPPVIPFLLMLLIGTTLEMLLAYEQRGKQIEKTQIEKVSAELSFLKSQINPHFFFNTLNSIYALAAIDSYNTQRAILLLSNLMRYLLYESNVDQVLLKKEIQFLNDFIGLQKLRGSSKNGKEINLDIKGEIDHFKIEPLLLVPFVENAFKHSHSYNKKSIIDISVDVSNPHSMTFTCSNSIGEQKEQMEESSGIGLENVKRRLELIYPESHQLTIDNSNSKFIVNLTINNEMYSR